MKPRQGDRPPSRVSSRSWPGGSTIGGTPSGWLVPFDATDPTALVFNIQFATFGDARIPGGLGLLAPAIAKAMGIPTGVILHNLVENVDMQDAGFASNKVVARLMTEAGRILTRLILRADYVALTIPRYVEMLRETYGAENVLLAPHGAFEEIVEPSFSTPDGPRQLLAFGKWGTYKTVDVLVEAYRLLLERGYDDIEVVVAGTDSPNSPGYLAGVAEGCRDLPGVRFTGYVAEEDVPASSATRSSPSSPTAPRPDRPASSTRLVLTDAVPSCRRSATLPRSSRRRDSSGSTSSREMPEAWPTPLPGCSTIRIDGWSRGAATSPPQPASRSPRCWTGTCCTSMLSSVPTDERASVAHRGQSPHWRRLGLGDRHVGRQRRQLSTQPAARSLVDPGPSSRTPT